LRQSRFPGGVLLHDYSVPGWFIIVGPEGQLLLPSHDGGPDFVMGSVFDPALRLPDGRTMSAGEALEAVWSKRLDTAGIVALDG
jgi:hypothetical protein